MLRARLCFALTMLLLWVLPGMTQPLSHDPGHVDASAFGERIDLSSTWLFTPTDKPAYASPNYDDHAWTVVTTSRSLNSYGFRNFPFCWYRLHVHLPPHARNVVLVLRSTAGRYQVFANGLQIAGPASLRAGVGEFQNESVNYRIPQEALSNNHGDLTLAIRFPVVISAGQTEDLLGPTTTISLVSSDAAPRDASFAATHDVAAIIFNACAAFLVGVVALALFLSMRDHLEYLAAAVTLLGSSAFSLIEITMTLQSSTDAGKIVQSFCDALICLSVWEFVRLVLLLPRTRLILFAEAAISLVVASLMPIHYYLVHSTTLYETFGYGSPVAVDLLIFMLLFQGWRQRNPDVYVLLPLFLMSFADDFWRASRHVLNVTRHTHLPNLPSLHLASYTLTFNDLDTFVFSFIILLFLVLRTVRIARERTRIAAEIEAAQSMQQLLLARSSQLTPGFDVQSVYLPASEVGGDFFLVSPSQDQDQSLIALIGDVSGKGLPAAMRVAMILGILRREDSREPAIILRRLNHALLSQGDVGFTTACCVRLKPDGAFTLANAGHISPYVNGTELETSPGLPLGLASDQDYPEHSGHLGIGSCMVLMSDGVVEARSKSGELYGFDRLSALSLHPAKKIASVAQAFGQDDDITVLTLACTT